MSIRYYARGKDEAMKVPDKYEGMGGDEFARFDRGMTQILSVPYKELKRKLKQEETKKARKKRARKPTTRSAASRDSGEGA